MISVKCPVCGELVKARGITNHLMFRHSAERNTAMPKELWQVLDELIAQVKEIRKLPTNKAYEHVKCADRMILLAKEVRKRYLPAAIEKKPVVSEMPTTVAA